MLVHKQGDALRRGLVLGGCQVKIPQGLLTDESDS